MSNVSTAKAWVGFAGSIIGALATALSDDIFDAGDTTQVGLALVTALSVLYAVWRTPNHETE
jgi:hypothetical protein